MEIKGIKNKFKKLLLTILTVMMLFNFIMPTYSHAATFGAGTATHIIQILFDALQHLIIHAAIPIMGDDSNGITSINVMGDNGTEVDTIEEIAEITKNELKGTADKEQYKKAYYVSNQPTKYNGIEINQNETELGKFGIPRCIVTPIEIFSGKIPILNANYFKDTTDDIEAKALMRESISSWYNTFRIISILGLLCVLIYLGIRIIISASVTDKVKYKHMMVDWLVALCLIFCLHYIMSFTMNIVDYLVEVIGNTSEAEYNSLGGGEFIVKITHMRGGPRYAPVNTVGYLRLLSTTNEGDNINELMYAIAYGAATVITLVFLFTYYKRFLTLTFLTFIAPLVALTYPIDKIRDGKAQAFNYWLREYITNAALPLIHIILYKVLISSVPSLVEKAPLYAIFVLAFLIPAEKIVKSMFGVKGETAPPPSIAGATLAGNMISKTANEAGSFLGGSGKKAAKLAVDSGGSSPKPSKGGSDIFSSSLLSNGSDIPGANLNTPQTSSRTSNPRQTPVPQSPQQYAPRTPRQTPTTQSPQQYIPGEQQRQPIGAPIVVPTNEPQMQQEYNSESPSLQSLRANEIAQLNRQRAQEYYNRLTPEQRASVNGYMSEDVRNNPSIENIEDAMSMHDQLNRTHVLGTDEAVEARYNRQRDALQNGSPEYVRAAHYYQGMNAEDRNNYLDGVARPGDSNFDVNNSQDFINGVTGENGYLANNQGSIDTNFDAQVANMDNPIQTNTVDIAEEPQVLGIEPIETDNVGQPKFSKKLKNLASKRFNIPAGDKKTIAKDVLPRMAFGAAKKGLKAYMMWLGLLSGAAISTAIDAGSGKDPGEIVGSAFTGSMTGLATGKSIGNGLVGLTDRTVERGKDDIAYLKHGEDFEKERKKKNFMQNRSNYFEIERRVMAEKGYTYSSMNSDQRKEVRNSTQQRMKEYWEYNDALGGDASMKTLHRMDDIRRDINAEEISAKQQQNGGNQLSENQKAEIRTKSVEEAKKVAYLKQLGEYNSSKLSSKDGRRDANEYIRQEMRTNGNYRNDNQREAASRRLLGRLDYLTGNSNRINRNAI